MPALVRSLAVLGLLFAGTAALAPAVAQALAPAAAQETESAAAIQAHIDQVRNDTALSAELRASLLESYERWLQFAKVVEAQNALAGQFAARIAAAPAELAARQQEDPASGLPPVPPPAAKLSELEHALGDWRPALETAAGAADEAAREPVRRTQRRAQIQAKLVELRQRSDALPAQPADQVGDPRLLLARRGALQAERRALAAEQGALQKELDAYDATAEQLPVVVELTARRQAAARAAISALQERLQGLRNADAARRVRDAERQVLLADPRLGGIAKGNAELAARLQQLARLRAVAERERDEARLQLDALKQDFEDIKKRLVAVGPTAAVGERLRHQRAQLQDDTPQQRRSAREREHHMHEAQLEEFDLDDQQRLLGRDPDRWLAEQLQAGEEVGRLQTTFGVQARQLRDDRVATLRALTSGYHALVLTLIDAGGANQELARLGAEYRTFVHEHVLWIRSSLPLWRLDRERAAAAGRWLLAGEQWQATLALLVTGPVEPLPVLLLLGLLAALLLRPLLRRRLLQHAQAAGHGGNVAFLPTTLALGDTLLLAVPLPGLLWLFGWRLGTAAECPEFGQAIAAGALHAATTLAMVTSLAELARRHGLGESHFHWQPAALSLLRRNLPLLLPVAFPLAFVLGMLEQKGDDGWLGSLGRLLLVPLLLLQLLVFWRLLHPRRGLLGGAVHRQQWLGRFRVLWFVLGCGTPLAFLLLTVFGYDYTALQLARRLQLTMALVLGGIVLQALIVRALLLVRRRLLLRQRAERRESAAAATVDGAPVVEADDLDPAQVAGQTQTLLRGGLLVLVLLFAWQVWIDVLPALGVLRQVTLWGDSSAPPVVTLADALLALLLLLATVVAARNLPGLLGLLLLQRLQLQAGERIAITTLATYGLVFAGVITVCSTIGIGWGKVQWLVAAISVGLGFGLQEIFANFVSGLILLFERPVRVGDIVGLGDVVGRVTRIRIRATTILDWDRRELVVPNREFVTGKFVNWTLTDPLIRSSIKVGAAYGTDPQRVLDLLLQAAHDSPFVLPDPAPTAVFSGFGDSALEFQLRVYEQDFDQHPQMLTDVHQRIDRAFRAHGIEMPFPQRDLNLRSSAPLVELLQRAAVPRDGDQLAAQPAAEPRPLR